MAEGDPSPPDSKLRLGNTISLSYSSYFTNFVDILRASWLWLIAAAALTSVASWQQWSWMATAMTNLKPGLPPQIPKATEMELLSYLANILVLFAGVSIAVAWHRLLILNERPGFSGSNVRTQNVWRYTGMAIVIFLIGFLPAAVVLFLTFFFLAPSTAGHPPSAGSFAMIPVILVLYAVGTAVGLRLSLLLPARAVGNPGLTFKQAWNRTRGNTWRLLWGIAATTIPPLLLLEVAFLIMIGVPNPAKFASEEFVARMTATSIVSVAFYLLIVPIGIGFLSHAYRYFFEGEIQPAE